MPAFAALVARHRSWVLVAAALLGLVAAGGLAPASPPTLRDEVPAFDVAGLVPQVIPAALAAAPGEIRIAADTPAPPTAPDVPAAPAAADVPAAPDAPAAPATKRHKKGAAVGITIDDDTGRVRVAGAEGSREFDSFEAFVEQAPWIAGLVFFVVFCVFLTPILIIALVIWYKMRKSRMLNETMIRLAEKGVVPPTEAFGAVAGGSAALQANPSTAPLYEQAREMRRKTVWSDLRKGVIFGAVGLGFTFYSMLDDGSPNFVGLVLLFVGLAYVVLWYFEERQAAPSAPPPPPAPPVA